MALGLDVDMLNTRTSGTRLVTGSMAHTDTGHGCIIMTGTLPHLLLGYLFALKCITGTLQVSFHQNLNPEKHVHQPLICRVNSGRSKKRVLTPSGSSFIYTEIDR